MRAGTLGAVLAAFLLVVLPGTYGSITPVPAQGADAESPLALVKRGVCETDETFAVALHGGAVFLRGDHGSKVGFVKAALTEARVALASGARAIDVAEAAIMSMENSGLFNAGKGSIANKAGIIEMAASIMNGRDLKAGSVASVKAVRNPISAARLVMDRSDHVMIVGPDADKFTQENGGAVADAAFFIHGGQKSTDVPLPDDMAIRPPDGRVESNKAAFSGTWAGVFQGSLNHVLVVEEIGPDDAKVIYAMGPYPLLPNGDGLYRRLQAMFVDQGLRATEPSDIGGFIVTYRLNQNDTLTATVAEADGTGFGEMTMRRITNLNAAHDGGTVGAVVRDRCGDLAAGTSTGGFGSNTPGRVGDSPIIGAGTYADNQTAAISATGEGEFFMRHVVAYAITAAMKYNGYSLEEAATGLIKRELSGRGLRGGVIAVDRDGNVTMPYNTEGMVRGVTSNKLSPSVSVF